VAGNDTDVGKAVALKIKTVNGHTDLVFADGYPQKTRETPGLTAAAEFAVVSTDATGLRLATLTGGTLLRTPQVQLQLTRREYVATVAAVDYGAKTMTVNGPMPAFNVGERMIEIGTADHRTCYMATNIAATDTGSRVTVRNGATLYASGIVDVQEPDRIVNCALMLPFLDHNEQGPVPGIEKGLVVSNAEQTKFWRAQYLGGDRSVGKFAFKLDGPVTAADFGTPGRFRVWEYGVGDSVRVPASAALRRVAANVYELTANTDVTVKIGDAPSRTVTVTELDSNGGKVRVSPGDAKH